MTGQVVPVGAPRHEWTLQGGTGHALTVAAGQRVHIVNTLGQQVVDTWALTTDGNQRLSMSHTRVAIGRLSPLVGDVLCDNLRQPMLRLVGDDSLAPHDTLIPACDEQRYRSLGFEGFHASCADNYAAAVRSHGIPSPWPVPDPLNLFMAVPVSSDGEFTLEPSVAPVGSRVILEAVRDILLIVSSCPQDMIAINGADGIPRLIDIYLEDPATNMPVVDTQ